MHYLIARNGDLRSPARRRNATRFQRRKGWSRVATNLAVVYAWSSELDRALETIDSLTKMPNGIDYGDMKLSVWWTSSETSALSQIIKRVSATGLTVRVSGEVLSGRKLKR